MTISVYFQPDRHCFRLLGSPARQDGRVTQQHAPRRLLASKKAQTRQSQPACRKQTGLADHLARLTSVRLLRLSACAWRSRLESVVSGAHAHGDAAS